MIESRAMTPAAGLLALALLGVRGPAPRARYAVRGRVSVASPLLRLGDLAPDAGLPLALAGIVLAPAPQPGSPLRLSRAQLRARLRGLGVDAARFAIPAEITVVRRARAIPRAAVDAAVAAYVHRVVPASELLFAAPLTTAAAPDVVVVRELVDAAHGRLELLCRDRNDPQLLPFAVSLAQSPAALAHRAAAERARQRAWARAAVPARPVAVAMPTPILVRPGHRANLVIDDPGFSLVTEVMPLEPGRKGQSIRVRSLATRALLTAIVTGRNQLRAAASLNLNYAGIH
jgi:hypothetical protein